MSNLADQIAQFGNMVQNDPENELGHYRLGQLLMQDGQNNLAAESFRRTIEISPQFSKAFQLLGEALNKAGKKEEAILALMDGFKMADGRGDLMPRDAMGKLLKELGAEVPASAKPANQIADIPEGPGGFSCKRPGCLLGTRASQLSAAPMNDELGKRIYEEICAGCWGGWLKDYSVKVINELRLNLSDEKHYSEYDRHMREYLGIDTDKISLA
jgi:tetratricopeptide (TPR) repeat protein